MAPRFLPDESAGILPGEKAFRLLVGQYAPLSGELDKITRNEPQTESIIVLKQLALEESGESHQARLSADGPRGLVVR
jgi:hypothetical protein